MGHRRPRCEIAFPKAETARLGICNYSRVSRPAKWGPEVSLHSSNPDPLMSALGQKQTFVEARLMSALPPKADIDRSGRDVLLCAKSGLMHCSKKASYSITLVGAGKDRRWYGEAKRPRCREVDD